MIDRFNMPEELVTNHIHDILKKLAYNGMVRCGEHRPIDQYALVEITHEGGAVCTVL
jgi:hypothetical protein